jgi:alkylhydroperoxidase family enzyme
VKELHPTSQGDLSDAEWAVLRYADKMTRDVAVDDGTFEALKKAGLSNQEIVEVTATVAGYNLVSRFLVALDVGEQNDKVPEWATKVRNPGSTDKNIQS